LKIGKYGNVEIIRTLNIYPLYVVTFEELKIIEKII